MVSESSDLNSRSGVSSQLMSAMYWTSVSLTCTGTRVVRSSLPITGTPTVTASPAGDCFPAAVRSGASGLSV